MEFATVLIVLAIIVIVLAVTGPFPNKALWWVKALIVTAAVILALWATGSLGWLLGVLRLR